MVAYNIMRPPDEELLHRLQQEERRLQEELDRKKAKLKASLRRVRARISTRERKARTRRLILLGSYIDSVSQTDPAAMTRLMKGLDKFLERDRDRALFDLPPRG